MRQSILVKTRLVFEKKEYEKEYFIHGNNLVIASSSFVSYDTIEPAHLYVEVKEGKFLDLVMWNNGNGLIKQLGYDFAGGYCKKNNLPNIWWNEIIVVPLHRVPFFIGTRFFLPFEIRERYDKK